MGDEQQNQEGAEPTNDAPPAAPTSAPSPAPDNAPQEGQQPQSD